MVSLCSLHARHNVYCGLGVISDRRGYSAERTGRRTESSGYNDRMQCLNILESRAFTCFLVAECFWGRHLKVSFEPPTLYNRSLLIHHVPLTALVGRVKRPLPTNLIGNIVLLILSSPCVPSDQQRSDGETCIASLCRAHPGSS